MLDKFKCPCGAALQAHSTGQSLTCPVCGRRMLNRGDGRWLAYTPAYPTNSTGSVPSGDVAAAEVRKLAERVTVLEGMVGELRRTVAELLRAPATAAPAEQKKGYWR